MSRFVMFLVAFMASSAAHALPRTQTIDDTVDDARIILTTLDRLISGDSRTFCEVRLIVSGNDISFSDGDHITVEVYEDDFVGDELVWRTSFNISAEERGAQRVDRTFNCAGNVPVDLGDVAELYAQAEIEKDDCGWNCIFDRPETGVMDLEQLEDDGAEGDDDAAHARAMALGVTSGRIARDQDWFSISLVDRAQIDVDLSYRPLVGAIDTVLYDEAGAQVAQAVEGPTGATLHAGPLAPGVYRVRTSPANGADYNFYDAELRVQTEGCAPGTIQEDVCGHCGSRRRVCEGDGTWPDFGPCQGEGVCAAGDSRQVPCGHCGTSQQTCSEACAWGAAVCSGEGVCGPGEIEREACDDGERSRTCSEVCAWGAFGVCETCEAFAEAPCYEGPPGTAGVGVCAEGAHLCDNGQWGECFNQMLPTAELCDDGRDNDCDGLVDLHDDDCGSPARVGDACDIDDDCAELSCEEAPTFRDGYCTLTDCDDDCPGGAVCGSVFGDLYCLAPCFQPSECRAGYTCTDVGTAGAPAYGCVPLCTHDDDCADPAWPECDQLSGLCVGSGAARVDGGPDDPDQGFDADQGVEGDDAGDDPGDDPAGDSVSGEGVGCGCRFNGGPADAVPLLLLVFVPLLRRAPIR